MSEEQSKKMELGRNNALLLFKRMSSEVPAYIDFLQKNEVDPEDIKTYDDFSSLPVLTKDNYLRKYTLDELSYGGALANKASIFSATSGTSGKPYYFPRTKKQNLQYARTAKEYLLDQFDVDKKSTLYINSFALGIWIGGIFTHEAITHVAEENNYALSIVSVGINDPAHVINTLNELGDLYDQVIVAGYPPFVKDIVDYGDANGFNWSNGDIKFIFSAESFSEEFRTHLGKKVNTDNIYRFSMNHYGSVDLGTMAHETPYSIYIRKRATEDKDFYESLFNRPFSRVPTIVQYDPEMFFFEEIDGNLICSADSGLPLLRYSFGDTGGILDDQKIKSTFNGLKIDYKKDFSDNKISVNDNPVIWVGERSDNVITLYGLNVYPEAIKNILLDPIFNDVFSGRFTMFTENDADLNQYLDLNIEVKYGKSKSNIDVADVQKNIVDLFKKVNIEYNKLHQSKGDQVVPKITLWNCKEGEYFKGNKQKWALKK